METPLLYDADSRDIVSTSDSEESLNDAFDGEDDSAGSEYIESDNDVPMAADTSEMPTETDNEALVDDVAGAEEQSFESVISHAGNGEGDAESTINDLAICSQLVEAISHSRGDIYADGSLLNATDQSIAQEMASIRDDLALAKGLGKRRRRGGPRERRLPLKIQELLGEGNASYAAEDMTQAMAILHEIIRIDATVYEAWVTLAQIQTELNNPIKALGLEMVAAHLKQDPDQWKILAEKSRLAGHKEQALYCLRRALAMAPGDYNAMWDQALLLKEQGHSEKALETFKKLLAFSPHDLNVLNELPPLFAATNSIPEGIQVFERAFDHHTSVFAGPEAPSISTLDNALTFDHITSLADFMILVHDYENVIHVVRRGQRWFQGRGAERHWDILEDDREFDPPETNRDTGAVRLGRGEGYEMDINLRHRLAISRLKMGHDEDAMIHIDEILKTEHTSFTVLWADIGNALVERGLFEKARPIFAQLAMDPEVSDPLYVVSLGICQQSLGDIASAIECFEHVIQVNPDDLDTKMKLALAYEDQGDNVRALAIVNQVLQARQSTSAQEGSSRTDRQQDPGPSTSLIPERLASRSTNIRTVKGGLSRQEQAAMDEKEARNDYDLLRAFEQSELDEPSRSHTEYISVAGRMITKFRMAKSLYPVDRSRKFFSVNDARKSNKGHSSDFDLQIIELVDRLQPDSDDDEQERQQARVVEKHRIRFSGLSADSWLEIVVKYACYLVAEGNAEDAAAVLTHVSYSNLFAAPKYEFTLRLALLSALVNLRDLERILEVVRHIIRTRQFCIEGFLLLHGTLGSGLKAADAFANLNLQKFILREVKLWDSAAKADASLRWNDRTGRWIYPVSTERRQSREGTRDKEKTASSVPEDDDEEMLQSNITPAESSLASLQRKDPLQKPAMRSATLYSVYGQAMLIAKSFQSAIYYFLRAYELNPFDPLLCLLLAQAYLGRALNRQSDNRHHQIMTGVAFLNRYRCISGNLNSGKLDEVEFNFGRAFHGLGMLHLAIHHYTQVLDRIEARLQESSLAKLTAELELSLARETAYNLLSVLVVTGAAGLARKVAERWLAV